MFNVSVPANNSPFDQLSFSSSVIQSLRTSLALFGLTGGVASVDNA